MPFTTPFQGLAAVPVILVVALLAATQTGDAQTTRSSSSGKGAARLLAARARYPAHWWAPVPKEGAPDWEILPQEAAPGEVIVSKRHELGLLSNFAATPFVFHGNRYASLEGFWQMMLYPEGPDDPRARFPGLTWPHPREEVARMTAFEAKAAGTAAEQNMARMGIDWVSFEGRRFPYRPAQPGEHYALIAEAMREKVRQNAEVKTVLLSTGDLVLRPDHHEEPNARAAWRYCDILMAIRDELRRGAPGAKRPGANEDEWLHDGSILESPLMPVTLSIKTVPDGLAATLRQRAKRNHRSLQGELMSILEEASRESPFRARALLDRVRALGVVTPADSVRLVRRARDRR